MNLYCNNCGNKGHLYRQCKYPVLSYGIICIHDTNVLMIQRKDSICYIEFLRGKYKVDNPTYIIELLNRCSVSERTLIRNSSFDDLWNKLWFSGNKKKIQTDRMIKEYQKSKQQFETLKQSNLINLLDQCSQNYSTPEWEFPKGRRSCRETNIQCAIREFEEETDLTSDEYILLDNVSPISEEYVGSNGVRYKHIYYLSFYKGIRDLTINNTKYEQFSEIGDIQWLTIDECSQKIRKEQSTKLTVIQQVDEFSKRWNHDFNLKE